MQKHLIILLFPVLLCSGCFVSEEDTMAAIQYSRKEDDQMHHYRPVHKEHSDWMIAESGKNLTIHAGKERIKVSARKNPDRILVRKNSVIIGQLEKTDDGAKYIDIKNGDILFEMHCKSSGIPASIEGAMTKIEIKNSQNSWIYHTDSFENAENEQFIVRKLHDRNRYSIAPKNSAQYAGICDGSNLQPNTTCDGTELESPFSSCGILVFHSDGLPLEQRAAASWFLSKDLLKCD